jgi:hypothetical protein
VFAGIAAGRYTIELISAAGQVVGTTGSIAVAPGAAVTGVGVSGSAAAVATGAAAGAAGGAAAASGLSTAVVVTSIAWLQVSPARSRSPPTQARHNKSVHLCPASPDFFRTTRPCPGRSGPGAYAASQDATPPRRLVNMFHVKRKHIVAILGLASTLVSRPAFAQSTGTDGPDPATMSVRLGPFLLNPRIELANLGVDSNVFNEADAQNPKKDFTVTITPSTDLWLPMGPSWLQLTIREDLVWYQRYASERSANTNYAMRWRVPLSRLVIVFSPTYRRTRDRPGFEIDARSLRTEYGGQLSVEVRAFSKTYLGLNGSFTKVDYDKDAVFLGSNLNFELNRTMKSAAVSVRRELTPLTSISLEAGQEQDRFEFSPLRDSNSTAISLRIALDPQALIKGSAMIGYRNFHPLVSGLPDFVGVTASGALSYTLLGMTKFGLQFKRDVSYSYDINEPYYVESGVTGSIAQQVFGPLDVVGRAGASTLAYRDRAGGVVIVSNRVDHIRSYGVGVGYHMGRDVRIGFNVDQQRRESDLSDRRYDGLRYGTSVTYGF